MKDFMTKRQAGKFKSALLLFFPPRNFKNAFQEILMCSRTFCVSWKGYMCFCNNFGSPGKFVGSYKKMSSPGNSYIFTTW